MNLFHISLLLATLLCSLVAGFLGGFSVVIMPGIKQLDDRAFIRSFKAMDGIIQNNQPIFMLVWIGSVLALLGAAGFGFNQLSGIELQLLIFATLIYLFGVQLPTIIVNVPLNNELQRLDISSADQEILKNARSKFESRWNRWNIIRTILATTTSLLLIIIVFLL